MINNSKPTDALGTARTHRRRWHRRAEPGSSTQGRRARSAGHRAQPGVADDDTAHYLPTNALRALDQLGLGEAVAAAAHPISRQRVTGAGGRYWLTSRCRPSGVNRVVARRSAVTACMSCCSKQLPTSPSVSAPPSPPGSAITPIKLSDGSVEHYDVLVGADGVDSVVRTAGIGGTEPTYTGRWAGVSSPTAGTARKAPGRLDWQLIAACSPCRWAKEPSSATPTSPVLTAGQPGTGETTSMISTQPITDLLAQAGHALRHPDHGS